MYKIQKYTICLVKDSSFKVGNNKVTVPQTAAEILRSYLQGVDREHFVVMMLDNKNKVIGINTSHVGTLAGTFFHPREIFKPAILSNAAGIIIAHNHPSGDATPSEDDRNTTKRIKEAGEVLGIQLFDHIIIGEEGSFYSFVNEREL